MHTAGPKQGDRNAQNHYHNDRCWTCCGDLDPAIFCGPYSGIGASSAGTIASASGLGNAAGSIAAGANSALNPSGNSFIVSPPGAIGAGVFVRPQR